MPSQRPSVALRQWCAARRWLCRPAHQSPKPNPLSGVLIVIGPCLFQQVSGSAAPAVDDSSLDLDASALCVSHLASSSGPSGASASGMDEGSPLSCFFKPLLTGIESNDPLMQQGCSLALAHVIYNCGAKVFCPPFSSLLLPHPPPEPQHNSLPHLHSTLASRKIIARTAANPDPPLLSSCL